MVPLGNAHQNGAWVWPAARKEIYANHLDDDHHLIAVTASANRSKGARVSDQWKPDNESYWCQYAIDWITIKETWELTITEPEHAALAQMLDTCANRPQLAVDRRSQPAPTSGPAKDSPTRQARTYSSCDAAQSARQSRVQGSKGNGRGFPKSMIPSTRDDAVDGVACER